MCANGADPSKRMAGQVKKRPQDPVAKAAQKARTVMKGGDAKRMGTVLRGLRRG